LEPILRLVPLRSPTDTPEEAVAGDARPKPGVSCVVHFPDCIERRWFEKPPIPGIRLRSHRPYYHDGRWYSGLTCVVDEVVWSGDTFTVFCVGRSEYLDRRRRSSAGGLDLTDELLELARHTRETVSEVRRRWKASQLLR
jgi:hypothetical protein